VKNKTRPLRYASPWYYLPYRSNDRNSFFDTLVPRIMRISLLRFSRLALLAWLAFTLGAPARAPAATPVVFYRSSCLHCVQLVA
jgi:hypothetical protein